tara:strand:+ start:1001 stop:1267 length:267 start_codon:yes stop_codon:yes gene_type:complete
MRLSTTPKISAHLTTAIDLIHVRDELLEYLPLPPSNDDVEDVLDTSVRASNDPRIEVRCEVGLLPKMKEQDTVCESQLVGLVASRDAN